MAISRKKITTREETIEEEYSEDNVITTNAPVSINKDIYSSQTGDEPLSEAPASTSTTNKDSSFDDKVGKTGWDFLCKVIKYPPGIIVLILMIVFWMVFSNFHECNLWLSSKNWEWIVTPIAIWLIITIVYLVAIAIYNKISK